MYEAALADVWVMYEAAVTDVWAMYEANPRLYQLSKAFTKDGLKILYLI